MDRYQLSLLVGVMPAVAQMASSLVLVPDLSPRETNGALASAIIEKASPPEARLRMLAGSLLGPTITKSLYITSSRLMPSPLSTKASSWARACTSTTSASPLAPSARAWPVPTATTSTRAPYFVLKSGRMAFSRPVSAVLVVVASRSTVEPVPMEVAGGRVAAATVVAGAAQIGRASGRERV